MELLFWSGLVAHRYNLRSLSLLLFDFSFSHFDLLVFIRDSLHRWSVCSHAAIIRRRIVSRILVFASEAFEFSAETLVTLKVSHQVESHDRVGWDVRCLVVKTTVHIDCLVDCPNGVSESLSGLELLPLTVLSLVDFHQNLFSNGVGPSS